MDQTALTEMPPTRILPDQNRSSVTQIVAQRFRKATFLLWFAIFMSMLTLYFILFWTPQILVNAGLSSNMGITGGALITAAGSIGMLLLGYFSTRFGLIRLISSCYLLSVLAMIAFALSPDQLAPLLIFTALIGFGGLAAQAGLYAVSARVYPPEIRTTGTGWMIGIGRIGAIIGPFVAGLMLEMDWQRSSYYFVFAIPYFLAAVTVSRIGIVTSQQAEIQGLIKTAN